jgi:hypothetical protein
MAFKPAVQQLTELTPSSLLAELLEHPERAHDLPPNVARDLLQRIIGLQVAVLARALVNDRDANSEDRLLTVDEAAARLGLSKDWLYRHAKALLHPACRSPAPVQQPGSRELHPPGPTVTVTRRPVRVTGCSVGRAMRSEDQISRRSEPRLRPRRGSVGRHHDIDAESPNVWASPWPQASRLAIPSAAAKRV